MSKAATVRCIQGMIRVSHHDHHRHHLYHVTIRGVDLVANSMIDSYPVQNSINRSQSLPFPTLFVQVQGRLFPFVCSEIIGLCLHINIPSPSPSPSPHSIICLEMLNSHSFTQYCNSSTKHKRFWDTKLN